MTVQYVPASLFLYATRYGDNGIIPGKERACPSFFLGDVFFSDVFGAAVFGGRPGVRGVFGLGGEGT